MNLHAIAYGIIGAVVLAIGAFFYGQHLGYQSRQAEEVSTLGKQFEGYVTQAGDAARAGTEAALQDFKDKTAVLASVASELRQSKGIMDNAAARLSASLRGGACFLTPEQRGMLECIRRPDAAACAAPAH